MNIERMQRLADHMRSLPEGCYDQREFFDYCNTPSCLAGHALALRDGVAYDKPFQGYIDLPATEAAEWLGLSQEQAGWLFNGFPFWGPTERLPTTKDAADVLEKMIAEEKAKQCTSNGCNG